MRGRQPVILRPPRIAVPPVRLAHRVQPRGGCDGERIQRVPQRFADHLDAVEGPHRGEYVGGVRPLPAPRLDELMMAAPREQGIEQQGLRRSRDQPRAKFTQD